MENKNSMKNKYDLSLFVIFLLVFYIFLTLGNLLNLFKWGNFLIEPSWRNFFGASASLFGLLNTKFNRIN